MKRKNIHDRLENGQPIYKAIVNLKNANKMATHNMLKRVKSILNDNPFCYFITFTINDDNYGLSKSTYRRKIKEALSMASVWVANEDFGKLNGRLHFHALVGFGFQLDYNMITSIYKYGNINFKPIYTHNAEAIRNYMLKLTLHASKDTANDIFYSRIKRGHAYV